MFTGENIARDLLNKENFQRLIYKYVCSLNKMQSSDSVILEYKYKSITDIIFERKKKKGGSHQELTK
jgi:hypothetical protein